MEQYYYLDSNNQQQGPVDKNDLPGCGVTKQTLVWKAGMANWRPVESIPELVSLFTATEAASSAYTQPPQVATIIENNPPASRIYTEEQFYYLDKNNQQQGPIGKSQLLQYGITAQTLVWKSGMPKWQPANTIPELTSLFRENPSPGYIPPTGAKVAPGSNDTYLQYKERPDNYLVWAILATVLCCVPAGIVAIIKAAKVNSLWDMKKYNEAYQAAEEAKKWCLIALGVSFVIILFYFFLGLGSLI